MAPQVAAATLKPFQLLEINVISAQDLERVSKKMKTYATAWVHPNRKLSTCIDNEGKNNPTWNDKFVFKVDEEFLRGDTSAVMIEIYAVSWFKAVLVGTVRVLVGNLIPPPSNASQSRQHGGIHNTGMRFVALQVRRRSGRPQGILNLGVALLDSSMRSMPLYRQLSASAVGFRDLMQDPQQLHQIENNNEQNNPNPKPILRRTKSERSELVSLFNKSTPSSSVVAVPIANDVKESSILSITESVDPFKMMRKKGKASSVINGSEFKEKPKHRGKKGKGSSVVSDSILSKGSSSFRKNGKDRDEDFKAKIEEKWARGERAVNEKPAQKANGPNEYNATQGNNNSSNNKKYAIINGPGLIKGGGGNNNSIWSDSEVGPSPSEVAALMAERRYPLEQDNQSSVLDGWSLDESVEGLKSKLERWRTELPPLYDRGYSSSSYKSSGLQVARKSRSESIGSSVGLFSCFGNICGYECQCVCGKPPKRGLSGRFHSPVATPGRSFL